MKIESKTMAINSELRQDLVSHDWILISPRRGRKPDEFKRKEKPFRALKKNCPFEDPVKAGGGDPILISPLNRSWRVQVVPNKYPVVTHGEFQTKTLNKGPYSIMAGTGHHDLVITKDHDANFPSLSKNDASLVFQVFKDRYLMLLNDKDIEYVSIFHNWGLYAGASIYHPHYQVISLPVVPPDVRHSLTGSKNYFLKNGLCVHCVQLQWERKQKKRIVFENNCVVAFAPFVSRYEFEIRLFPKNHQPFFEDTPKDEMDCVAEGLRMVLRLLEKSLKKPDYNFFIHTAPISDKQKFKHYHWHIEIQPKINIRAGFELGTGMEINVVDPDEAARFIRNA